jgi:hypothetical protein
MQILNSKYSVGTNSWNVRTPKYLKFACDVLVFASLVMSTLWTDVDWVLKTSVALKLLSNFVSEHMPVSVQQAIKDNPIEPVKTEI